MVKIRLRRMGAKGQPSYRVVIADSRSPRDGRFIEIIGHYNPRREPSEIVIDKEKALAWMAKGAQPSDSVYSLMARVGIVERRPYPGAAKAAEAAAAPPAAQPATARARRRGRAGAGDRRAGRHDGCAGYACRAARAAGHLVRCSGVGPRRARPDASGGMRCASWWST